MNLLKSNKNFKFLFLSRSLAIFSNSFFFICILKWIELKTNSSFSLSLIFLLYYLPGALLSLPIGSWVEKITLQKTMIYSDGARILTYLIFVILFFDSHTYIAFFVIVIDSVLMAFFYPASQSLLPSIVKGENDRVKANSFFEFSFISIHILGHIICAYLIKLNIELNHLFLFAIILNVTSYLFIYKIKPFVKNKYTQSDKTFTLLLNGIQYVKKQKTLLLLFLMYFFIWMIDSSADVTNIVYLNEVLNKNAEDLAFINSFYFIGSTISALIFPKIYKYIKINIVTLSSLLIYLIYHIGLNFTNNYQLMLINFTLVGFVVNVFYVYLITYIQNNTPSDKYSRVFSLNHMITNVSSLPLLLFFSVFLLYFNSNLLFIILTIFNLFLLLLWFIMIKRR